MPAMAMRVQASLALGVTAAVVALAGCGGGSGNSFTIKANESGHVAYLVVTTAIPHRVIEPLLVNGMQSYGAAAFVTSSKPTGALDCRSNRALDVLGIPDIPTFGASLTYALSKVSIEVYGTGSFADQVCSDLLSPP
jgi:hypothetical protein